MQPNAKKRKLNESPSALKKLEFLDLNDDCIRHILWNLSPTDLCSMSFTCVRMQELLFDHFPRQFPDERLTIALDDQSKTPHFRCKETKKHVKYFSKCIRNVRIVSCGTYRNLQCLFDFLHTECCANLQKLQLNIEGHLKPDNVEVIKSRLENLSTLAIMRPYRRYDIHDTLLKYCKKLEHLKIFAISGFDASWMLHEYPTIKTLSIQVYENHNRKTRKTQFQLLAKKFFQLNPQITSFECWQIDIIETLLRNVINIERLSIHLDSWSDFRGMSEHLKECSKESQIKWFQLSIEPKETTVEDYATVKCFNVVQPIHSLSIFLFDLTNELTFLSQLQLVRKLDLTVPFPYQYENENELLNVLSKLPNLQDLAVNLSSNGWVFKDVAMKFVQNSFRMRQLVFRLCQPETFVFHPYDLFKLNQLRLSVSSAAHIVFQMDYPGYVNFVKPTFIYPATLVLCLKFTSRGDQEL